MVNSAARRRNNALKEQREGVGSAAAAASLWRAGGLRPSCSSFPSSFSSVPFTVNGERFQLLRRRRRSLHDGDLAQMAICHGKYEGSVVVNFSFSYSSSDCSGGGGSAAIEHVINSDAIIDSSLPS